MGAVIIYQLPLPPSVNAMFANVMPFKNAKGKTKVTGRVKTDAYRAWRRQAGLHVVCQGPLRKISGPVAIRIIISDQACGDLDNRCKAILDFLVHHKIIEDDKKDIVRKILLEWGDVEGAQVEISEQVDWTGRRNLARKTAA